MRYGRLVILFSIFASGVTSASAAGEKVGEFRRSYSTGEGMPYTTGNAILGGNADELRTFQVYTVDEVYTKGEIDGKLTTRDTAESNDKTALETEIADLRTYVHDSVSNSLKALPSQLFTEDIKRALVTEITTHLQSALDARMDAMKAQIEADVLTKVQQTLKSNPH